MTWSIFSLYLLDNYPEKDVKIYLSSFERDMEKKRGFIKFKDFNQELVRIYNENKSIMMQELFEKILKWSKKQQSNL